MEINTISSFNRDQRARVSDNTKVGAALGAVAGAAVTKRALQNALKEKGYTDTFINNVKDFANAKTLKKEFAEKVKESLTKKEFVKKIANNRFVRGGAIGAALLAGTAFASLIAAKVAKDSTELKIAKEVLD